MWGRDEHTSIPTGRIRRTAKVAGLAGGPDRAQLRHEAANLTRGGGRPPEAAGRRLAEAAEQILDVLGNMKGAAMKVGQWRRSYRQGAFPESSRSGLGKTRRAARLGPARAVQGHAQGDRERAHDRCPVLFADFDEDAVAAASIGQVYRASSTTGATWP